MINVERATRLEEMQGQQRANGYCKKSSDAAEDQGAANHDGEEKQKGSPGTSVSIGI
jgi:hypothetical protein